MSIANTWKRLREGDFSFRIDEVMTGEHEFVEGCGPPGHQPFEFSATWGPRRASAYFDYRGNEFLKSDLDGRITVGGLCENVPCTGTMTIDYFGEHTIRYDFRFEAEGKAYRYVGEKVNIQAWNLPVSHTTCFGVVTEEATGRLVSRSVTHFRLRSAPTFLASLRLTEAA